METATPSPCPTHSETRDQKRYEAIDLEEHGSKGESDDDEDEDAASGGEVSVDAAEGKIDDAAPLTEQEAAAQRVVEQFVSTGRASLPDGRTPASSSDDATTVFGTEQHRRLLLGRGLTDEQLRDPLRGAEAVRRYCCKGHIEKFKNVLFGLWVTAVFRQEIIDGAMPPPSGSNALEACSRYYGVGARDDAASQARDEEIARLVYAKICESETVHAQYLARTMDLLCAELDGDDDGGPTVLP